MTAGTGADDTFEGGDDVLAGEYVLGVLDAAARRDVERRMARDPAFAALVDGWQERLSPLDAHYEAATPPRRLYAAVEARLFPQSESAPAPGLWQSLAFWRGMAVASLAVLVALAVGTVYVLNDRDAPTLVAQLTASDASVDLIAHYDAESGRIDIVPAAAGPGAQNTLQLWLIETEGAAPVSLGILPASGEGRLVVDSALRRHLTEGATLAISLEPEGGSPTGAPTGPVVATGAARRP